MLPKVIIKIFNIINTAAVQLYSGMSDNFVEISFPFESDYNEGTQKTW